MSTFLQLVNDLERESGTVDKFSRAADVTAPPTARQEKMVEWIKLAWEIIQNARSDWRWMRREFSAPLAIGQSRYMPADLAIADFSAWAKPAPDMTFALFDTVLGMDDLQELRSIDYDCWRARYARVADAPTRPSEWSVDYDNRLCIGPTPDKNYTLVGEYRRAPQTLMVNDDVPLCPPEYHQIIVWRALMMLGDHDEAPTVISTAAMKTRNAMIALVNSSVQDLSL